MDAVTYPHDRVKKELVNWVLVKVDIGARRELADLFGVPGVPVALAVTSEGVELERIAGFVEPARFCKQLARLR